MRHGLEMPIQQKLASPRDDREGSPAKMKRDPDACVASTNWRRVAVRSCPARFMACLAWIFRHSSRLDGPSVFWPDFNSDGAISLHVVRENPLKIASSSAVTRLSASTSALVLSSHRMHHLQKNADELVVHRLERCGSWWSERAHRASTRGERSPIRISMCSPSTFSERREKWGRPGPAFRIARLAGFEPRLLRRAAIAHTIGPHLRYRRIGHLGADHLFFHAPLPSPPFLAVGRAEPMIGPHRQRFRRRSDRFRRAPRRGP